MSTHTHLRKRIKASLEKSLAKDVYRAALSIKADRTLLQPDKGITHLAPRVKL